VLITGAGVVGLLTGLFALHHGAAEVVAVDGTDTRLKVAEELGMVALADSPDVPRTLKRRWRHGPADHGADVAFQCRGQVAALATALAALRPQGTVVDLAFYQGGAEAVRLGEEFHHNGLGLRCAQIGRVPRGLAHSWSRSRLSAETVELLRAHGAAVRRHLVTDLVPLDEAPELLADLADRRRPPLGAVFTT
jgi:threonine dehydrogenase-like Zn-dependent dehydrogenase